MHKQELDNTDPNAFDIELVDQSAHVSEHIIKCPKVFRLVFNTRRPALYIIKSLLKE